VKTGISSSASHRSPQIDALRGCALLLIFFVHYTSLTAYWLPPESLSAGLTRIVAGIAHAGTDLFFTLTGYLVYGSLMSRDRPVLPYIRRRFGRIYPTFLFVMGVYLIAFMIDPADNKLPPHFWPAIAYIAANLLLLPGLFPIGPIVTPAWSLSYLALFYIAAPTMVAVLGLRHRERWQRAALFLSLAALLFLSGYFFGGHVRLAMFCAGMMLYEYRPTTTREGAGHLSGMLFATACVVLAILSALGVHPVVRYLTLFCMWPLAAAFSMMSPGLTGPLSWPWLRYLGRITLSYIMIHGLTLRVLVYVAEHTVPAHARGIEIFWLLLVPAFLATAVTSSIVYAVVERSWDERATERTWLRWFAIGRRADRA